LEIVGPKLKYLASEGARIAKNNVLLVHCWRGGMRSNSMAWLFGQLDIKTYTLKGGYKTYRRFIIERFSKQPKLMVLGGMTGSGKTKILKTMGDEGYQILNLEEIARHKGSVFGGFGQLPQPTQEQFENDLFSELQKFNYQNNIWVEDESLSIGKVQLPKDLYNFMREAPLLKIRIDVRERIKRLVDEYAIFPEDMIAGGIEKISKKLGSERANMALEALKDGNYDKVAEITLNYYDKAYKKQIEKRPAETVTEIDFDFNKLETLIEILQKY
jgi:tRNA 2-selenouridine synthase